MGSRGFEEEGRREKDPIEPDRLKLRRKWERDLSDKALVMKLTQYLGELRQLEAGQTTKHAPTVESIGGRGLKVERIVGYLSREANRRMQ